MMRTDAQPMTFQRALGLLKSPGFSTALGLAVPGAGAAAELPEFLSPYLNSVRGAMPAIRAADDPAAIYGTQTADMLSNLDRAAPRIVSAETRQPGSLLHGQGWGQAAAAARKLAQRVPDSTQAFLAVLRRLGAMPN